MYTSDGPGLVVSDLDGTLLGRGSVIQEKNSLALQKVQARGIPIAIASGRMAAVCSQMALDMGLTSCRILGLNGGQIWDAPFGHVLETHAFPEALRARCLSILRENNCVYTLYTDEGAYTNQPLDEAGRAHFTKIFQYGGCRAVMAPDAAEQSLEHPCLKFLVKQRGADEGYLRAQEALAAMPEVYLTTSKSGNFEIMLQGIGKAEAVQSLALHLGVPLSRVAAFGDYDNDVPMLKACGLSVAMGNALPEAAAAARFSTRHHDEAGVAWALEHMLDGDWAALEKEREQ